MRLDILLRARRLTTADTRASVRSFGRWTGCDVDQCHAKDELVVELTRRISAQEQSFPDAKARGAGDPRLDLRSAPPRYRLPPLAPRPCFRKGGASYLARFSAGASEQRRGQARQTVVWAAAGVKHSAGLTPDYQACSRGTR